MAIPDMWSIDLAVAAGFLIGVVVKQLIDLRIARRGQTSDPVRTAKRRNAKDPRL